jgi:chromosome partitioning protein
VAVIDADPQGTASEWAARHDDTPPVYSTTEPTVHKNAPALADSFDILVIDGAPRLEDLAVSVIKAADLVLVPVRPSAADIWAADDIIDLVRARQQVTGRPGVAFVVSQQVQGSNLAATVQDALDAYGVPVFSARTSQRVAYAEALGAGRSVIHTDGRKAAKEIRALAAETLQHVEEIG